MGIIISTSKKSNNCVFVLSSLLFIHFPGGKHNCLHAMIRYKLGKSTLYIITSKSKMVTLAGNKQLFHPSLPSQDAPFPSFDRKWTNLIRRRWKSKCLFPRGHIVYSLGICTFRRWEVLRLSLIRKVKIKYLKGKMKKKKYKFHDFSTKIHLIIIFMLFSSSVNLFIFYSLTNEEKLVALLVYSSFRRVATSGIRNSSVATSSVSWI